MIGLKHHYQMLINQKAKQKIKAYTAYVKNTVATGYIYTEASELVSLS